MCWLCQHFSVGSHNTVVFFSVAETSTCTVDKPSAEASEDVMYTCSTTPVSGSISISLTIENNGSVVTTGTNSVTWPSRLVASPTRLSPACL